ncbi:FO synthase subunit 1 [Durusdinium trenchii]|uniref:FO synthase subunit 1 n=1 Tax=Durusdinium trenchii TaxID=1381693 RepID=A0ABP0S0U0_9DINO
MGKRVSSGSAGGRAGKKPKGQQKADVADDPKFAHVRKICDWLFGGPDRYLMQKYKKQARVKIEYSVDMTAGAKYLRLWQLSFRSDFGLPGMSDPFDMCTLIELVLTQGFRTDANAGAEKLNVTVPSKAWLEGPYKELPPLVEGILSPFSIGFIKGWRRGLAALIICEGVKSLGIELSELTDSFKASLRVVHGAVSAYSTPKEAVWASRGITMSSTQTRRPPNAMNFIRQLEVLQKSGESQEWHSSTSIARAFHIGDKEAKAVAYLQTRIGKAMVEKLRAGVRKRGMRQWLSHDVIAAEMFNEGWSSGKTGALIPWQAELTNLSDNALVECFLDRLEGDWDRASTKKSWMYRDAWSIHAASGGFLAIIQQLRESVPQKDYQEALPNLWNQFKLGILDGDILTFLEGAVPPVSLDQVPFVRNMITAVEQRKLREAQQTEREIQDKINSATVEQIRHQFNKDMATLRCRVPNQAQIAKDAALDKKKGIPAHSEIISSYLRGIECQDGDIVIFVDCLPNRYCEFGQAILARHLDESNRRPPLYYLGFLREEQRDTAAMIEDKVYKYWDSSDMAPGKQRPSESIAEPTLELLSWVNSAPRFPDSLLTKFGEGTGPHSEIHAMKKELLQEFPQAGGGDNRPTSTRPQTVRASGRPDYSIDGGGRPLDTSRVIQAAHTAASAFGVERKWYCPAARGKPAVVIDSNFAIHLGNETDQEMSLTAMEICGFNTGTFEQKIIAGLGEAELDGVCFRFSSDLCLVSYERKLYAIADFLHHCMTVHGVAEIDFSNHQLIQKTYPLDRTVSGAVLT